MDAFGQRNPFAFDMAKGFLHFTEQASGSREVESHLKQLTDYPVPFVESNPLLGEGYGRQNYS